MDLFIGIVIGVVLAGIIFGIIFLVTRRKTDSRDAYETASSGKISNLSLEQTQREVYRELRNK